MAKRMTKEEKIQIYVRNNRDEIAKKLEKNRYEKVEEQQNFEEKIRSIIPCNECIVRGVCADKFKTNWMSFTVNCEILQTFNEANGYVAKNGTYKESPDYKQRLLK